MKVRVENGRVVLTGKVDEVHMTPDQALYLAEYLRAAAVLAGQDN